jgi:hypothetical protein
VIVDFDGEQGRRWLTEFGLMPHVRSGTGGAHVHVRHPGASVKTMNAKSTKDWTWRGVDIRGDGGYAVTIGRNHNGPYQQLRDFDDTEPFRALPVEFQSEILGVFAKVDNPPQLFGQPIRYTDSVQERLIAHALNMANSGHGRNNSGFWLACQLRDNGCSRADAYVVMRRYSGGCPGTNVKGQLEPYTDLEIRASLRQAFSAVARDPWGGV